MIKNINNLKIKIMPDELGNLVPGDEGYVAPVETTETPVEETPTVEEQSEVVDETTVEDEVVGEPVADLSPTPSIKHTNIFGSDFYTGKAEVNPDNELLTFSETDVNKENR